MKFEHAYKGIGKIITAEWFSILATITGAIALLFGVTAWAADHENIKEIFDYTIGGFTIVTLITLLFLALSFIINIIGLAIAGKDDSEFIKALVEILIAVAATAVSAYFGEKNPLIKNICDVIASLVNTVVMMHVVNGIANLADKLFNTKMINRGKAVTIIIMVTFFVSLIGELVVKYIFKDPKMNINVILSVASIVMHIVQYFAYMIYLGQARKMLKA